MGFRDQYTSMEVACMYVCDDGSWYVMWAMVE